MNISIYLSVLNVGYKFGILSENKKLKLKPSAIGNNSNIIATRTYIHQNINRIRKKARFTDNAHQTATPIRKTGQITDKTHHTRRYIRKNGQITDGAHQNASPVRKNGGITDA